MWSSHLCSFYYMMQREIEIERGRDGCGLCFGSQRSDMLCYISPMTNQTVSVLEEREGESLDEQQQTLL